MADSSSIVGGVNAGVATTPQVESPTVERAPTGMATAALVQRKVDWRIAQRRAERGAQASGGDAPEAPSGGGAALPQGVQSKMEGAFGADFSDVRVHQGGHAQALGATAYAQGSDLHFAPGQYAPDNQKGQELLGHELAHVVQQREGRVSAPQGKDAAYVEDAGLEHEADEHGARASRGEPVGASSATARTGGPVQRTPHTPAPAPEITPAEVQAAIAWATADHPAAALIRDLQTTLGVAVSGNYDEATARAVFARQRQWQPHGAIAHAGQAGTDVCRHLGLIYYHEAQPATVGDPVIDDIRQRFPNGITVALYAGLPESGNNAEFARKAREFATNQHAVGLVNGAVTVGVPCVINQTADVLTIVNSIHRGLLAKYRQAHAAQGAATGGPAAAQAGAAGAAAGGAAVAAVEPAFTKVHNLALFCHGEGWGVGLNAHNDFSNDGLRNTARNGATGVNPSNVQAFARGLSEGITSDVRVELFACSSASDSDPRSQEWLAHGQGDRLGQGSFAQSLATSLGPDASVSAHATVGHTTENYAARVFGHEAGGGAGGLQIFDVLYPETYIQSELARLFPDKNATQRAALHNSLREQMWAHYRDCINGHSASRFPVPMGQEMFVNPDNARRLLHADWTTVWITAHLGEVRAPAPRRS